ncbi:MAG TPA: protein kinase [Gammaproteobacteria bacterium]
MTFARGDRFGLYEVIELVGVGGMGEVYRARDTRLQRDVALKVLPEAHWRDPEVLRRFEREAQLLASLNHPNIATLHGFESSGDEQALVMELVDGETLADRLARARPNGLQLNEVLKIAHQIAQALDAAHESGVVHRDLKPANIKVRSDGTVKVLDFGIAKVFEADPNSHRGTTVVVTLMPGAIVGTASYMSPEQASGRAVDRRTDIWAFGCVLYEMLSGGRAFEGHDDCDTYERIATQEPDWDRVPRETPAAVGRLLRRCLRKERRERLRDIGDALVDLNEAHATSNDAPITERNGLDELEEPLAGSRDPPFSTEPDRGRRWWPIGALVAAVVAVIAVVPIVFRDPPVAQPQAQEFVLLPPEGMTFGGGVVDRVPPFAVSPDGRRLALVVSETSSGRGSIWIRSLDTLGSVRLSGTDGGTNPFWSPDGRFVAFFADGKLKKVDVAGGSATTLAETDGGGGAGGTWNRDGVIIFAPSRQSGLFRVSDAGGTPTPVTQPGLVGDTAHVRPQFLPDGRHFLYLALADSLRRGIYAGDLTSSDTRRVLATREMARYAASGHLLFLREGRLMAQEFDATRFALSGEATPVAESVAFVSVDGRAAFDVSETGTLVYRVNGIQAATQPHWIDRSGNIIGAVGEPGDYQTASLSPDRSRLAVEMHDLHTGTGDLWIIDLIRGSTSRLTFDGLHHNEAVWSPDGNEIVFAYRPDGGHYLYRKAVGGDRPDEALLPPGPDRVPTDWSRDGRYILYEEGPNARRDLWALQMPDRTPLPLLQSQFNETGGRSSPDGRWVAYVSDETGRLEVYVRSFPGMTDQRKISVNGGKAPRWSRDGAELFFVGFENAVYAVAVAPGVRFESGTPRLLFKTDMRMGQAAGSGEATWTSQADLWFAVDDQRFLIVPNPTGPSPPAPPLTVVRDWASALKRNAR